MATARIQSLTSDVPTSPRAQPVLLAGLPIDPFTPDELIRHLVAESGAGRGGYLVTPNLDHLQHVRRDPVMRRHALNASIRVADGMPLMWASKLRGTPLPARVAGSDLIFSLSGALAKIGHSVFLLGGDFGTAHSASQELQGRFPGLVVAGTYFPPFGFEDDQNEIERIRNAIVDAAPDFVYLGLPFAKASFLAEALQADLPRTWFLGLGVSFSFVTGAVNRAPRWLQRLGLEWAHRFVQEPQRLFRRYVLEGLPFGLWFLAFSLRERSVVRRQIHRAS